MPPGRERVGAGAQDRAPACARAARAGRGLAPARVGAGGERAEVRARRVDEHAVVAPPAGGSAASAVRTSTQVAPIRRRRAPQRVGAAGVALDGDERRPRRAISAARWVVLPPGAAHRSSTRSPGAAPSSARDGHRGARLRHEQALAATRARRTRRTARRARSARRSPAGVGRHREPLREVRGGDPQRVGAQRGLGGLVVGGHQRARGVGAERVPPQPRDPLGVRVAQRGLLRRVVGERVDQRRAPRARRGAARR